MSVEKVRLQGAGHHSLSLLRLEGTKPILLVVNWPAGHMSFSVERNEAERFAESLLAALAEKAGSQ